MELLNKIQQQLKVPKGHKNTFGNYNYRNAEDILEAVKPLLGEGVLTLSDEIVDVGGRIYVKATAVLQDGEDSAVVTAYAREALDKKGMDEAQITGAASSYARKYALCGLFAIDDGNDADGEDNRKEVAPAKPAAKPPVKAPPKPEEPATHMQNVQERAKKVVSEIAAIINERAPELKTKEERGAWIKKQTGLSPSIDNNEEILVRLKAI